MDDIFKNFTTNEKYANFDRIKLAANLKNVLDSDIIDYIPNIQHKEMVLKNVLVENGGIVLLII